MIRIRAIQISYFLLRFAAGLLFFQAGGMKLFGWFGGMPDGATAQVEDVYTVPSWRNRGCARRLITRAIVLAQDAGHELVFIEADDNGWPKQLYSRLGFDPIGRIGVFHRDVA